ncbi:MAG: RsmG family class I SAM-dependent methyltransferase [Balneolaceae bacterium]
MNFTEQKVSRETLTIARTLCGENEKRVNEWLSLLEWWNQKINLVSRNVSRETLREHVVHSMLPWCDGHLDCASCWVDAGSGGGFPGIPLALMIQDKKWVINDIVDKKVSAVRQMVYQLKLKNVELNKGSIEGVKPSDGWGLLTKHAFSVVDLMEMIDPGKWTRILFYKGVKEAREEVVHWNGEGVVTLYSFDFGDDEPFYQGKGLLVIKPANSE